MKNNTVPEAYLARSINAYLRELAARSRESAATGPFFVAIDTSSDNLYRNYAIPVDAASPTDADIAGLISWFAERRRTPRLEYVTAAAPDVEQALLHHGFRVEGRLPLMTCRREELRSGPCPEQIDFVTADSRDLLRQAAAVQKEAYEGGQISEADVERLAKTVASGGRVVLAVDRDSGEPAGAGLFCPPLHGVTEIAAIAVAERFRRRGIAAMLTVTLARQAFDDGIDAPFLMAAHEAEERIYGRVGFVTRCEILHISLTSPPALG